MTKIKLGNKSYKLEFTLNSFVDFEEETGKSLFDNDALSSMTAKDLRALLWCALDGEMTVEEVGKLITPGNMGEVNKALEQAFEESSPKSEGK